MEDKYTTQEKVDLYLSVDPLLDAMYDEFKELSKKKPDGVVNTSKIKIVNRLLTKCNDVLNDEMTIHFLDLIDEDSVPQNSDIVLMLSQYGSALKRYRSTYYKKQLDGYTYEWYIE